jgi:tagaturonate epimerase
MILEKYSMGIGDRFAQQGNAQLNAFVEAAKIGINVTPIWNKSFREHQIIHSNPQDTRKEANQAVKAVNWKKSYYVDADHINLSNVDIFMDTSDFFTIDVADYTGKNAEEKDIQEFAEKYKKYIGDLKIPGINEPFKVTRTLIEKIAEKYLLSVQEAGKIYRHIEQNKGLGNFVTEVSMDETDLPQTPLELFFILAGLANENIPVQTIAPKFTGRFNKGVDYVGDLDQFEKEFNQDLAVIEFAIKNFGLPENLKLSIHSGSDKFSIFGPINKAIKKFNVGLHLKTAGTTWLEELIGLAEADGEGLAIAKETYVSALARYQELAEPYATVIDIDKNELPTPETIKGVGPKLFADMLRHDLSHPDYNINFRQLLHVGYKVAAEMGEKYLGALKLYETSVARNVTENILKRHIEVVFG